MGTTSSFSVFFIEEYIIIVTCLYRSEAETFITVLILCTNPDSCLRLPKKSANERFLNLVNYRLDFKMNVCYEIEPSKKKQRNCQETSALFGRSIAKLKKNFISYVTTLTNTTVV